jgi:hypothetical protein
MKLTATILAISFLMTGCSAILMETVDDRWKPAREPRCTESSGFAVWDGLLFLGGAGGGVAMVAGAKALAEGGDKSQQGNVDQLVALGIGSIVLGAVHLASAGYGTYQADRCANARRQRDWWLAGERE